MVIQCDGCGQTFSKVYFWWNLILCFKCLRVEDPDWAAYLSIRRI